MIKEKVFFLSVKGIETKKDWSGIPYYMHLNLSAFYDIEYLGAPKFRLLSKAGYYLGRLFQFFTGTKYIFDYGIVISWFYGRYYTRILKGRSCKFIFVPAGLTEIAFLKTKIPIVSVGDCSVLQLINYYPALGSVSNLSLKEIAKVEKMALAKTSLSIFSSPWATNFVDSKYHCKNYTIPFGANTVHENGNTEKTLDPSVCRLLFIGVDWERKGGNVVMKIYHELSRLGVNCNLTILGCNPPDHSDIDEGIELVPYFDKDSKEGEGIFIRALSNADFFVLPTQADCTPIVIAEAFSVGLPVLATRTGGISSMVENGVNGFLFEQQEVLGYVSTIQEILHSPARYATLSRNCQLAYENEFNWKTWGSRIQKLVEAELK